MGNFDIVVCSDGIYALPGIFARRLRRTTFVYNAHEVLWAMGDSRLISTVLRWVEWLSLRVCDFWMAPSEARAEIIRRKHGSAKRCLVYENFPVNRAGLELREAYRKRLFQAGVPPTLRVLMFQGSLTHKRGLEPLLQAARTGAFHLVVQGDGPLSDFLKKNSHEHVTRLPPCPNDEAVSWLSAADLSFVYYENDCLNSAQASSSKFYASVFAGVPVVGNRLPSFEKFAERHGGVVFLESLEPRSVARAVSAVLSDDRRYQELRRQILAARQELAKVSYESLIMKAFQSSVHGGDSGVRSGR